jgi:26S proteasome regulatory subunit N3
MPGKTPNGNGKEPVENGGYPGSKDIDMKDESSSSLKGKGKKGAKDGDEEMTVVVPISKKQSSSQTPNDADGDVSMDDADKEEDKVDPVAQAVSGNISPQSPSLAVSAPELDREANTSFSMQISRVISRSSTELWPCSTPDLPSEPCDLSRPSANDLAQTSSPRSSSRPSPQQSHLEMWQNSF